MDSDRNSAKIQRPMCTQTAESEFNFNFSYTKKQCRKVEIACKSYEIFRTKIVWRSAV